MVVFVSVMGMVSTDLLYIQIFCALVLSAIMLWP